jgi:LacI family transcriptional regulator
MVTIYDIAKACNCSSTTVSKVFNHAGKISQEKTKEILDTAEKLGYYPSSSAVSLASKRSNSIGVILHNSEDRGLTHQLFNKIFNRFRIDVETQGYDLIILAQYNEKLGGTYLQRAQSKWVDGVFCLCCDYNQPEIKQLLSSDVPTVCFDYDHSASTVMTAPEDSIKLMVDALVKLGHRHILYIKPGNAEISRLRFEGFKKGLSQNGIAFTPDMVRQGSYFNSTSAQKIVDDYLKDRGDFTVIMAPDDYTAIGVVQLLKKAGVNVPEDIQVTGYDGILTNLAINPTVTTVVQDTDTIADAAADLLFKNIHHQEEGQANIYVPASIFLGETTKEI